MSSSIFEPTCANARWAHMHHFASVQKMTSSLDIKADWKKLCVSGNPTDPTKGHVGQS